MEKINFFNEIVVLLDYGEYWNYMDNYHLF